MRKFWGGFVKPAKAGKGLTLSVCLCKSTCWGEMHSQHPVNSHSSCGVSLCLDLRRRHKEVVSSRTGLEEAAAIYNLLVPPFAPAVPTVKAESASLFPALAQAGWSGSGMRAAGHSWATVAPAPPGAGSGLLCACAWLMMRCWLPLLLNIFATWW